MNLFRRPRAGLISSAILALALLTPAVFASAATLSLSSASAQVTAGDIVTVRIAVNSSDQAINTAEGSLEFPSDVLQALSIDKSSSIFSIWVEEPTFSNATGEVSFSGGLPTPGYQGANGTVLKVSFIAKHSGIATLSFANADVRANDGLGTNVLDTTGTLQLSVIAPAAPQPVVAPPPAASPPAQNSSASPPTITSSNFSYDPSTGMLSISAKVRDTAGIAGYRVTIDDAPPINISPVDFDSGTYQTPVHVSGSHTVLLSVTDNAGNQTAANSSFVVPTISTPVLDALPATMFSGGQLSVQGKASGDNASVLIYIAKDDGAPHAFSVTPEAAGSFVLLGPIVQRGIYRVWSVGVSTGGILSDPSPTMQVAVSDGTAVSFGPFHLSLEDTVLIFLLFSLGSFLAAALGWYKVYTYHRGRKRAVLKIQKDVHHALKVFKEDIEADITGLENAENARELTGAESKLRDTMKSDLTDLEKYIDGEVS